MYDLASEEYRVRSSWRTMHWQIDCGEEIERSRCAYCLIAARSATLSLHSPINALHSRAAIRQVLSLRNEVLPDPDSYVSSRLQNPLPGNQVDEKSKRKCVENSNTYQQIFESICIGKIGKFIRKFTLAVIQAIGNSLEQFVES